MPLTITDDPINNVLRAAENEFPGIEATIYYDDSMMEEEDAPGGYTSFCTCHTPEPKVGINASVGMWDVPDILAHELAHVAVGKDAEAHGEAWATAYRRIYGRWFEIQHGAQPKAEQWAAFEETLLKSRERDDVDLGDHQHDGEVAP